MSVDYSEMRARLHKKVPWQEAYAYVCDRARAALIERLTPTGGWVTTHDLKELLFPKSEVKTSFDRGVETRIFAALEANATRALADCAERQPAKIAYIKGKRIETRPWHWFLPSEERRQRALAVAKGEPAEVWCVLWVGRTLAGEERHAAYALSEASARAAAVHLRGEVRLMPAASARTWVEGKER